MELALDLLQLMLLAYLAVLIHGMRQSEASRIDWRVKVDEMLARQAVEAMERQAVPPPPHRGAPWLCRTMEYRYQSGAAHDFHTNPNCPKHNTDMEFSELTREYGSLLSVTPLTFCHESTHLIED